MTSHGTRSLGRRLLGVGVCAALLAQIALPAVHALTAGDLAAAGALLHQASSVAKPVGVRAASPLTSHDAATCPVCQTLLRTSPVVSHCDSHRAPRVECVTPTPEAQVPVRAALAQIGHPPRAPPSRAIHLG